MGPLDVEASRLTACMHVGCGMHVTLPHTGSSRQELHMHTYPLTYCPGSNGQGIALCFASIQGPLSQMRDMLHHSASERLLRARRIPRD